MKKRSILPYLKASYAHYDSHRASRMGAALSFYTIFSIIPLLSLIVIVVGSFVGDDYVRSTLGMEIAHFIGAVDNTFLDALLTQATAAGHGIATFISVVVLVIGTLGVLYELKNALDDLWNVRQVTKSKHMIRRAVVSRLLSLSIIPVLVFLMLVSLVFSALLGAFGSAIGAHMGVTFLFKCLTTIFTYLIVSGLFAFVYRYLPEKKLPWKEIFMGALATAFLFMLGKTVIGLYIARIATVSVFGAAGALIIILLWIYYSVQIFFFGASLTYVYSDRYGYLKEHPRGQNQ